MADSVESVLPRLIRCLAGKRPANRVPDAIGVWLGPDVSADAAQVLSERRSQFSSATQVGQPSEDGRLHHFNIYWRLTRRVEGTVLLLEPS